VANLSSRIPALVCLAVFVYGLGAAALYWTDPLPRAPQLDAKEVLELARQIDQGELANEPFYRAMLYPGLLSLIEPPSLRPLAGLLLGLGCHFLNAWLVGILASKIWGRTSARWIASGLYGLYPVSLFFALQILDITFAISLFLSACLLFLRGGIRSQGFGGILAGMAVLARPHFLPAALCLPFLLAKRKEENLSLRLTRPLLFLGLTLLPLLGQGLLNQHRSGEFRVLPWQGAYNLWAANRPGANGLYFKQSIALPAQRSLENPTRVASRILYAQESGESPPFTIDEMNAWWTGKTWQSLAEDPLRLARHFLWKVYAVLNTSEQYNNLTYGFHRERLPFLLLNPLHWGLILILGVTGSIALWRREPKFAAGITLLAGATAVGLVLYYASARFRLPLVPFLAIGAAGLPEVFHSVRSKGPSALRRWLPVGLALTLALVTYSRFGNIRSSSTHLQDQLLLANAHADLGEDLDAAKWARVVLGKHPEREEALRIYTLSYFNWAVSHPDARHPLGPWSAQKARLRQTPPTDPVQDFVLGVFYWKWDEKKRARQLWSQITDTPTEGAALSTAALRLTRPGASPNPRNPLEQNLATLLLPRDAE